MFIGVPKITSNIKLQMQFCDLKNYLIFLFLVYEFFNINTSK